MSDTDKLGGATRAVQRHLDRLDEHAGELVAADIAQAALDGAGLSTSLDQPEPWAVSDESRSVHTHLVDYLQSSPLFNHARPWTDRLCEVLVERRTFGLTKYGTVLYAGNGRSTFLDALAEVVDALAYVQVAYEQATSEKASGFTQVRRLRLITMALDLIEEDDRVRKLMNRPGRGRG